MSIYGISVNLNLTGRTMGNMQSFVSQFLVAGLKIGLLTMNQRMWLLKAMVMARLLLLDVPRILGNVQLGTQPLSLT